MKNMAVAITDHNTMKGAYKAKEVFKEFNIPLILGEEVTTDKGDILALFIKDEIKPGDVFSVIDNIKSQGGLVVLPHPFYRHKDLLSYVKKVDMVEVINARIPHFLNVRAQNLAAEFNKPASAGSDAHASFMVGMAYLEVDSLSRKSILNGKPFGKEFVAGRLISAASQIIKNFL